MLYENGTWVDTTRVATSLSSYSDTVNLPWDTYDYRWPFNQAITVTPQLPPTYSPILRYNYPSGQVWPI